MHTGGGPFETPNPLLGRFQAEPFSKAVSRCTLPDLLPRPTSRMGDMKVPEPAAASSPTSVSCQRGAIPGA